MPSPAAQRRFLRYLLEAELDAVDARQEPSRRWKNTQQVLHTAIKALDALEQGEVHPIFVPAPTTAKGALPATLRDCRRWAVTFVARLKQLGWSVPDAGEAVGKASGAEATRVLSWRRKYKPLKPQTTMRVGNKIL